MKKAIMLGNYIDAIYHSFIEIDNEFNKILGNHFELTCTADFDCLKDLSEYDLFVSYTDTWNSTISNEQLAGLITFVVNGGGLLAIHNGISLHNREEFIQLLGAKFTGHPEKETIQFVIKEHAITSGVNSFELMEEPYQFSFDNFSSHHIFMEYIYQGKSYPAGWSKEYGTGKVVFLTPGHTKDIFACKEYQKLIRNSAKWVCNDLEQ